jgi:hypothetical protein
MGKILGNASKPYGRRTWRGHQFDNRTVSALKWAEAKYRAVAPKKRAPWRIGQGSYSNGSLSAGTHSGGGAVDIMFAGLTKKQQRATVKWLRKAGFAAWARTGPGWVGNEHAHAILRGHRNAHPAAKAQVIAYDNRRDGLAGNLADSTWRPKVKRRWSHRKNRPILGK